MKADGVLSAYKKAVVTIDNLSGINRTAEEQSLVLAQIVKEQEAAERRVLALCAEVDSFDAEITKKLDEVRVSYFRFQDILSIQKRSNFSLVQLLDTRFIENSRS